MRNDLIQNWGVEATVVYDKPNTSIFAPINLEEKHELYKKLSLIPAKNENKEETLFTIKANGSVQEKKERPILLVSSTSWTKDEVIIKKKIGIVKLLLQILAEKLWIAFIY